MPELDIDFVRAQFPAFAEPSLAGQAFFENAGGSYPCGAVVERLARFYRSRKVQPYAPYAASRAAGAGFYRLPDGQISGDTARAPDAELRPKHGYGYTVTSQPGKGDGESLSGDEVPLHGIRVQTDFKQSTV